jgi:hypothetical protein
LSPDRGAPWTAPRRGRLLLGVVGLVLALAYGGHALTALSLGRPSQPGPGVFPLLVGALMVAASLALVWEQLAAPPSAAEEPRVLPRGADLVRVVSVVAGVALYAALVPLLGHLVASFLLSLILLRLLGWGSWRRVALTALALAVGSYLVFELGLDVALPKGSLL